MSNLTSPAFDTPGTRYCGARWWASGPVGCKVLPPRPYAAQRPFSGPPGTHRRRGVGAGIATWAGRGHAAVRGVVIGTGVALCYDILMSGWERKMARHRTGMYLDEKLSHRIFLLTTAPRHALQAPLPGPFETKLPPAILRHLPMTRAARARQGRQQLVWGAGGGCRGSAMRCRR